MTIDQSSFLYQDMAIMGMYTLLEISYFNCKKCSYNQAKIYRQMVYWWLSSMIPSNIKSTTQGGIQKLPFDLLHVQVTMQLSKPNQILTQPR